QQRRKRLSQVEAPQGARALEEERAAISTQRQWRRVRRELHPARHLLQGERVKRMQAPLPGRGDQVHLLVSDGVDGSVLIESLGQVIKRRWQLEGCRRFVRLHLLPRALLQ